MSNFSFIDFKHKAFLYYIVVSNLYYCQPLLSEFVSSDLRNQTKKFISSAIDIIWSDLQPGLTVNDSYFFFVQGLCHLTLQTCRIPTLVQAGRVIAEILTASIINLGKLVMPQA